MQCNYKSTKSSSWIRHPQHCFRAANLPVMHICGDVAQHGAGVYRLAQLLPNILTNGLIYRKRDRGHPPAQQGAWCIFQCCIRIRIRGPMPLTNASWSGSCYFNHWSSRRQQKTNFKKSFSAYYFLKIIFQRKKSKRSHKTVEIKVFLTIFA